MRIANSAIANSAIANSAIVTVGVLALSLLTVTTSAAAQPSATATPAPAAHAAVTASSPPLIFGTGFTVHETDPSRQPYTAELRPQSVETLSMAASGRSRYRVVVRYKAIAGSVPSDQTHFVMVATGGERFSAASAAPGAVPALGSGILAAPAEKIGAVDFDVPADGRALVLAYAPGPSPDIQVSWTLVAP